MAGGGNDWTGYKDYQPDLVRYDGATRTVVETADFVVRRADPHGLTMHEGKLVSCDAGIHPELAEYG